MRKNKRKDKQKKPPMPRKMVIAFRREAMREYYKAEYSKGEWRIRSKTTDDTVGLAGAKGYACGIGLIRYRTQIGLERVRKMSIKEVMDTAKEIDLPTKRILEMSIMNEYDFVLNPELRKEFAEVLRPLIEEET